MSAATVSASGSAGLGSTELPGRMAADPLDGIPAASSVRLVRLRRTAHRRAHVHPRCEEIVYVAAGTASVWVDGTWQRVGVGDFVHIPPGAAHATVPDAGTDVELVCFLPDPDLASNRIETHHIVTTEGSPP